MTLKLADRIKETTTTTGTGALTLAGAMTGFAAFSSALSNADTCFYALQAVDGSGNPTGAWEVGLGTYTSSGNTLGRTLIASSTGSLINLAAGTTQVWLDVNAGRFVALNAADSAGTVPLRSSGGLYTPTAFVLGNLTNVQLTTTVPNANVLMWWTGASKWINYAPTLGSSTTTLDPSVKPTDITLSNGNLTITGTAGAWSWNRSLNPRSSGKFYAECTIVNVSTGVGMGVANSAEATVAGTTLGNDTNGVMFYNAPTVPSSGIFYNNATVSGSTPTTPPTTGDVFGMAVDLGLKKVWFWNPRMSLWNNDVIANQNPATGTGGFDLTAIMSGGTGALYLGVAKQGNGSGTLNVGATAFSNAVPSGFGPWDSLAPLADVNVANPPNDGDMLIYSGVAAKWQNVPAPGATPGFVDGNFDQWNVNTTFSLAAATDTYTADMWICNAGSGGTATVSQNVATLGAEIAGTTRPRKYRLSYQQTAIASQPSIGQKLEGVSQYSGQSITVSGTFAAAVAGTDIVGVRYVQNFGTGGSPSATVTATTAVTWALGTTEKRFSVRLDIPSISGKTLGTGGNDYLRIDFMLANSATYTVYVSQCQIDVALPGSSSDTTGLGGQPLPFRYAGLQTEKSRVERYLFSLGPLATGGAGAFAVAYAYASTSAASYFVLPTAMRATPAGSYSGAQPVIGIGASTAAATVSAAGPRTGFLSTTAFTGLTIGQAGYASGNTSTASTLLWDARL